MYTLVLMTAMTTAPEAPQFNGYFHDLFCGCCGSSQSGSYSGNTVPTYSCYGGCSGSTYSAPGGCCSGTAYLTSCNGCNGCNGESAWQRVRRWFEGLGCCGGCHGCCGGCCGGYGSGYGCSGASPYGYFGSGVPAYPYPSYPGMGGVPSYPTPAIPYASPETAPVLSPQNTGFRPNNYTPGFSPVSNGNPGARAVVLIKLPADARLYADNKALALQGTERRFVTPELPGGQDYVYRFRVEYDRNGETLSATRKVAVRSGAMISVEFADLTAARTAPEKNAGGGTGPSVATTSAPSANTVANPAPAATPSVSPGSAAPGVTMGLIAANPNPAPVTTPAPAVVMGRATIKVTLPPGAILYVDDQKNLSADSIRQFSTPPLPAGKEYVYVMKAELIRNGRAESVTQKVPFHAGERVEVDFTAGLK